MRKRILAILMAFALFIVMAPVDMFAFATDEEAAEDTKVEMQSEEAVEEAAPAEEATEETAPAEEATEEAAPAEEATEEAAPAEETAEEAAPAEEATEEAAPAEEEVLTQAATAVINPVVGTVTANSVHLTWSETLESGETITIKYAGNEIPNVTGNSYNVTGLTAGTAYTFVRKLGLMGERKPMIVLFFSMFSCVCCLPFMILDFAPMTGRQLLCLVMAGVSATVGQMNVTAAYSYAPAREISVFDYSQVLFAAILGFFAFGEIPDAASFIGYAVIIGTAIVKWRHDLIVSQPSSN